jgi:four helix bundle protein
MGELRTHKDLDVWKQSIELVTEIYGITKSFPKDELYGLVNQIRRAAVSIPSNIAEGAARKNNKEFIQFLYIALGSISELETQIIICQKLSYLNQIKSGNLLEEIIQIRSLLIGLIKFLKKKNNDSI